MSTLDDFLDLPDINGMTAEISVEVSGKTLTLRVRPISENDYKDYQHRSSRTVKGGAVVLDQTKLRMCILENHIVEPNFADAAFLSKAGCMTAYEFLERKFPAGVLQDIVGKVLEISGFMNDINEEVEEAKN